MYTTDDGVIVLESIDEMMQIRLRFKKEKNFKASDLFRDYIAYFHFLKIIDLPDDRYEIKYFNVLEYEQWLEKLVLKR